MVMWWEHADRDEKDKVSAVVPGVSSGDAYPIVRDALLEALFASASELLLLPIQDVFGWRDRVNDPSLIAGSNWVFRLPWLTDRLDAVSEAAERQQRLHAWAQTYAR
jgi:4-alpha-glucanotransferase